MRAFACGREHIGGAGFCVEAKGPAAKPRRVVDHFRLVEGVTVSRPLDAALSRRP
jgi:hypothetical protein